MNPYHLHALGLAAAIVFLPTCSAQDAASTAGTDPAGQGHAGRPEAYVAKGRVTDSAGRPMRGVEVYADHTLLYNANLFGVTDANGDYRIELGGIEPSSWRIGARIAREFDGLRHEMSLRVDDPAPFAGRDGAIRNLQWRLSGDDGRGDVLGATANVYVEGGHVDPAHLELRFEPVALIDGTRGEAFVRVPDGTQLVDVPIGRHRVSARHLPPGGVALPLRVRLRDTGDFGPWVEAGFRLRYSAPVMELQVEVPPDLE